MDFRDKTRRRWLNYEAHEEAYLENSAFIHYAARLRFHYSLVQSKVIDLETLASIGHYYFIRMAFFLLLSRKHEQDRIYIIETVINITVQYTCNIGLVSIFLSPFLFRQWTRAGLFLMFPFFSSLRRILLFLSCSFRRSHRSKRDRFDSQFYTSVAISLKSIE